MVAGVYTVSGEAVRGEAMIDEVVKVTLKMDVIVTRSVEVDEASDGCRRKLKVQVDCVPSWKNVSVGAALDVLNLNCVNGKVIEDDNVDNVVDEVGVAGCVVVVE
eukprot:6458772-Amphidinium_carterae.1